MNSELSIVEKDRFGQLERIVSVGLSTFYEVGSALREIADKKFYRQKYVTFEEYCQRRWNISRRHAYRLMASSEVADDLRPMGHKSTEPITKERQLRPLTKIPKQQRKKAWSMAKKSNPVPTAKDVQASVEKMRGTRPKVESSELSRTSTFEAAFKLLRMRGEGQLELDFGEFGVTIFLKGNN
jgi:hypothetical protein